MVKHLLLIIFAGTLLVYSPNISAQCKGIKTIVKNSMPLLNPYEYDSYAVKEIIYSPKAS